MHLVIISGAARPQSKSNTAKVIAAFQKGFEESGNTTEVWYLSDRHQWESAADAFARNDRILIAFPLYVENIPGILLEFLSGLRPKQTPGTKLARHPKAAAARLFWRRFLLSWDAAMPGRSSRAICSVPVLWAKRPGRKCLSPLR